MVKESKNKMVIFFMGMVILILLIIIFFQFVFIPKFNEYVLKKQIEAQNLLLAGIVNQISLQGYVDIPLNESDSLVLIPYSEGLLK
jgi:hypothetical protein